MVDNDDGFEIRLTVTIVIRRSIQVLQVENDGVDQIVMVKMPSISMKTGMVSLSMIVIRTTGLSIQVLQKRRMTESIKTVPRSDRTV